MNSSLTTNCDKIFRRHTSIWQVEGRNSKSVNSIRIGMGSAHLGILMFMKQLKCSCHFLQIADYIVVCLKGQTDIVPVQKLLRSLCAPTHRLATREQQQCARSRHLLSSLRSTGGTRPPDISCPGACFFARGMRQAIGVLNPES